MPERIYNAVSSFPQYKTILSDSYNGSAPANNAWCDEAVKTFAKDGDISKKNICVTSIKYLEEIKGKKNNLYISNGCKYLYYRIYDKKQEDQEYSDIIYEFYKKLLKEYISKEINTFEDNTAKINKDIYEKLKNLDELYDNFNEHKNSKYCNIGSCVCAQKCAKLYEKCRPECYGNYNTPFCVELHKFAERFNVYLRGNNECNKKIEELKVFNKNNSRIVITGSAVLLVVIVLSLFILYKIIQYRRKAHRQKSKMKNIREHMNQKINPILPTTESEKTISKNISYNISYKNLEYS
ncbi:PIR protein [Plasmodium vivax]|nr:PIR protein [Plasmodium vivax]